MRTVVAAVEFARSGPRLAPAAYSSGPTRANRIEQPTSLHHPPREKAICETTTLGVWALVETTPSRAWLDGHLRLTIGDGDDCIASTTRPVARHHSAVDNGPVRQSSSIPSHPAPIAARQGRHVARFAQSRRPAQTVLVALTVGHHRQRMRRHGCPSLRQKSKRPRLTTRTRNRPQFSNDGDLLPSLALIY